MQFYAGTPTGKGASQAQLPRVSSEEALQRMLSSMQASGLPDPAPGGHRWISCLPSTSSLSTGDAPRPQDQCVVTSGENAVQEPHNIAVGQGLHDQAPNLEAASPQQSSSHNSTVCSIQSWVNLEAAGESNAVSKYMLGSELPDTAIPTDYTQLCSKGAHALPTLSQSRLTREAMQLMDREQYAEHVHGARLADIVRQIRVTSPFGRFEIVILACVHGTCVLSALHAL